jgi:thioredoxin
MNSVKSGLYAILFICTIGFFQIFLCANSIAADNFNHLPVKGMVNMIDLGAKKCIPCKMMAPIMKKMEKKYEGRAKVVFIDVWENREQATRFGIRAIPTQIFFDTQGAEVFRHVGFMSEDQIVQVMGKLGVNP